MSYLLIKVLRFFLNSESSPAVYQLCHSQQSFHLYGLEDCLFNSKFLCACKENLRCRACMNRMAVFRLLCSREYYSSSSSKWRQIWLHYIFDTSFSREHKMYYLIILKGISTSKQLARLLGQKLGKSTLFTYFT